MRRAANFPYKSPLNETGAGERQRSTKNADAVVDLKNGKSTSSKSIKGKRAHDMPLKQPSVKHANPVSSPQGNYHISQ